MQVSRGSLTSFRKTVHKTHMMMPPDMVIFDCDGVVVDSEPTTARVLISNLSRYGLLLTPQQLSEMFLGGTMMRIEEQAKAMGAKLPDTWLDDTYTEVFAALAEEVEPIPGIVGVLDVLAAANIPVAIGSNGPHRKMHITLSRTGLAHRFGRHVYSREDVERPKPAPDVYLKAAREAGVPPDRCVVIEDSANGAKAAKAANMHCLGFAADTAPERLTPVVDDVFRSMSELPALLGLDARL